MNSGRLLRGLLVVAFIVVAALVMREAPDGAVDRLVDWSRAHPLTGAVVYILFVSIATVLFLPGSVSMMLGGFLFGVLSGSALALLGIVCGAQLAFYASRSLARESIEERIHADARLHAIDSAIRDQAFTIVLLTRLALLIPYNLLNYVYGATSVRPVTYLRATVAGMLPVVVLYVYIGSLARNVGQVLSGEATPSNLAYWLAAIGFAAIAAVTWLVHRAASKALRSRLQES